MIHVLLKWPLWKGGISKKIGGVLGWSVERDRYPWVCCFKKQQGSLPLSRILTCTDDCAISDNGRLQVPQVWQAAHTIDKAICKIRPWYFILCVYIYCISMHMYTHKKLCDYKQTISRNALENKPKSLKYPATQATITGSCIPSNWIAGFKRYSMDPKTWQYLAGIPSSVWKHPQVKLEPSCSHRFCILKTSENINNKHPAHMNRYVSMYQMNGWKMLKYYIFVLRTTSTHQYPACHVLIYQGSLKATSAANRRILTNLKHKH